MIPQSNASTASHISISLTQNASTWCESAQCIMWHYSKLHYNISYHIVPLYSIIKVYSLASSRRNDPHPLMVLRPTSVFLYECLRIPELQHVWNLGADSMRPLTSDGCTATPQDLHKSGSHSLRIRVCVCVCVYVCMCVYRCVYKCVCRCVC